ncbi:MAG: VWA domain-containing protein [Acidobacteriota bacterium]|nr:VWA domain-containing protein [Acidobacteriota bacterium]
MIEAISWARPEWFGLLLMVPLYGWLRFLHRRHSVVVHAPLQGAPPAGRGRSLLRRRRLRGWAARLAPIVELTLVAVAAVALAGPSHRTTVDWITDEGVDVQLVLDVSLSMLAEDFPPNRLEALQGLARELLAKGGSNRLGLVIFARDAYVQSPLTTDHRALRNLLDGVTVDVLDQVRSGGTAIGDALVLAIDQLQRSRIEGRGQALVLITDGASNLGLDPVLAARYAAHQGVRFYAIGVGGEEPVAVTYRGRPVGGDSPYLAVLDTTQLEAMTEAAGGSFYRAVDEGALEQIFDQLSRLERAPLESRQIELRRSWVPPLAGLALILFAILLALESVIRRPLA